MMMEKKSYSIPCLYVELFATNNAIAACATTTDLSWTFDCMAGNQTDTTNCLNATLVDGGCSTNIGYAEGITTAIDPQGSSMHSNLAGGKWSGGGWDGSLTVTYSGAAGLLYADTSEGARQVNTSYWTVNTGSNITHSSTGGLKHHNVAPVTESQVQNMSNS